MWIIELPLNVYCSDSLKNENILLGTAGPLSDLVKIAQAAASPALGLAAP